MRRNRARNLARTDPLAYPAGFDVRRGVAVAQFGRPTRVVRMKKIKRLFRSGNIGFSFFRNPRGKRSSIQYNNRAFFYRRGMVDTVIMERVLFLGERCEYRLPARLNPSLILDLGSNIGASVVYFKKCWPAARIVAVEPAAANYALLCDNTGSYNGIQCLGCAVGGTSGRGSPVDRNTPNISPYRISQDGSGEVDILSFEDLPLGDQPVDLIKIDIEGQDTIFSGRFRKKSCAGSNGSWAKSTALTIGSCSTTSAITLY